MSKSYPSIAVAHEHFPARGGGEYVAEELARTFDAPIITGFVKDGVPADDVDVRPIANGRLGKLFGAEVPHVHLLRDAWYMWGWETAPLTEYDIIVQSGNNPGWYVPKDDQTIIRYVHSTPRTAYDLFHDHGTDGPIGRVYSKVSRQLYQAPKHYATLYLANSELVARRLRKYWGVDERDIRVVYPPVNVDSFGPEHAHTRKDYYFTFSRLYPNKRIGEIIKAFNRTGQRLIIGGDGPDRERLKDLAGDSVEFIGYISEEEKRHRLAECKAFVFNAKNEDFGMVPVEAMASGAPVLGVNDGYTQYQVRDAENGIIYDRGVAHLSDAIRRFETESIEWSPDRIQRFAEQYSMESFRDGLRSAIDEALERDRIVVDDPTREAEAAVRPAFADGGEN